MAEITDYSSYLNAIWFDYSNYTVNTTLNIASESCKNFVSIIIIIISRKRLRHL